MYVPHSMSKSHFAFPLHSRCAWSVSTVVAFATVVMGGAGCAPAAPEATTNVALVAPHQPPRVLRSHVVGRVQADTPIDFVLGLTLRDRPGFERLLQRQKTPTSGDFRRYVTPKRFADDYAPNATDYEALATALTDAGFQITRRVDGRSTLSVRGTAEQLESLFGTELLTYRDNDLAEFFAPSAHFKISASSALYELVETVVGLDDANRWRSHRIDPPPASPNALPMGSADPIDLRTLYGVPAGLNGAGETVAILGTGDPPRPADLTNFVSRFSLATNVTGQYALVLLGGPNRDPAALALNEYYENVLDIDMVLGMAPLANVVHVHTASNSPGLFADGMSFIVNQVPQAHAASLSYGTCEAVAISNVLQNNNILAQAQAQGQAWFVASGDDGTDACKDGSANGVPSVDWPAASPYVLGVGGTELSQNKEVVWGGLGAGGGGQSQIIVKPSWQQGVGPYPNDGARDVPDISALAGSPGVTTVVGTSGFASQGTSAAAPIWAGVWAMLDQARGGVGMTDFHDRIYTLGKSGSAAFNDITVGSNVNSGTTPGYSALPGFDLATGWGTPNLQLLVGALP